MNYIKCYLKEIFLVVIIFLICGLYVFIYYFEYDNSSLDSNNELLCKNDDIINNEDINNQKVINDTNEITLKDDKKIAYYAEVKGCVNNPGVFNILDTTIIKDLIVMAGGVKDNAYTNNINFSMKAKNEMVVYVYCSEEYDSLFNNKDVKKDAIVENVCECEKYDISSCINEGNSIIEVPDDNEDINDKEIIDSSENNNKININTASKEELMMLSGIGEAKANSIIEYREKNGNFTFIEDIIKVNGISDAIYEKIKDNITV